MSSFLLILRFCNEPRESISSAASHASCFQPFALFVGRCTQSYKLFEDLNPNSGPAIPVVSNALGDIIGFRLGPMSQLLGLLAAWLSKRRTLASHATAAAAAERYPTTRQSIILGRGHIMKSLVARICSLVSQFILPAIWANHHWISIRFAKFSITWIYSCLLAWIRKILKGRIVVLAYNAHCVPACRSTWNRTASRRRRVREGLSRKESKIKLLVSMW